MIFVGVGASVGDREKNGNLITFSRKRLRGKFAIVIVKYVRMRVAYFMYFAITDSYKEPSKKQKSGANESDEELESKPFLSEYFERSCKHALTAVKQRHA